ncbi:MAG: DUF3576 domain-containing protein [Rhodospirillales bacterium]
MWNERTGRPLVRRALSIMAGAGILAAVAATAGCNSPYVEEAYVEKTSNRAAPRTRPPSKDEDVGIFGPQGLSLSLWGDDKKKMPSGPGGNGVAVNSYLWRASLDTIAFMPLASADPFGGVIITDWFTPPEAPSERFKMNVYILDRDLRADAIKVTVFRQARDGGTGSWVDAGVKPDTATNLENQILSRARELRMATASR